MRVLMLGWEFPPMISGGLGTACCGLARAMDRLGIPITFILPGSEPIRFGPTASRGDVIGSATVFRLPECPTIRFRSVPSSMRPYGPFTTHAKTRSDPSAQGRGGLEVEPSRESLEEACRGGHYGPDLYEQVHRYTQQVLRIAEEEDYDVIHAHDWMTFPASAALANHTGVPLVVHVHSTEFDRSGERVNQYVYDIERRGMHAAATVIAVSNYTRNICIQRYHVAPEDIEVVYNGVEFTTTNSVFRHQTWPRRTDKVVLFLGRVTMQKGPEYFLYAAKRVLEKMDNVRFILAGDGDMLYRTIELAAELRIGQKVFFTHFLRGADVDKAYRLADLYVMPSVSEPFGIAPLEALQRGVPVLVSRQSGIAETLKHALKVDFWDVDAMGDKIVAVLQYPPLHEALRSEGQKEALRFRWEDSAMRVNDIYQRALSRVT